MSEGKRGSTGQLRESVTADWRKSAYERSPTAVSEGKRGNTGQLRERVTAMRRPEECLWKKPVDIVRRKTREHRSASGECNGNAPDGKAVMEKARQLCGKKKHGISGGLGKDVTAMRRPEECL